MSEVQILDRAKRLASKRVCLLRFIRINRLLKRVMILRNIKALEIK